MSPPILGKCCFTGFEWVENTKSILCFGARGYILCPFNRLRIESDGFLRGCSFRSIDTRVEKIKRIVDEVVTDCQGRARRLIFCANVGGLIRESPTGRNTFAFKYGLLWVS